MTSLTSDELAVLLANGERVLCAKCGACCRGTSTECFACKTPLRPEAAPAAASTAPSEPLTRTKPKRSSEYPAHRKGKAGSLADLPGGELVLVVRGKPISQGSMRAVAAGVLRHQDSTALKQWRDAITREALVACGRTWVPCDAAVEVDVTFTVPPLASTPTDRPTPSTGYRDLDKLERAVGDAMCPSDPTRFRVYSSDMRICDWHPHRTYPRPVHTHPDALDEPGVVIRVRAHDPNPDPLPDTPLPVSTKRSW